MKTLAFLLTLTTFAAAGCAPPRELIQPASAEAKELNYIYFVEQEQKKDPRLKRCEIAADNSAKGPRMAKLVEDRDRGARMARRDEGAYCSM